MIKKKYVLWCLLLLSVFVSCNKDDIIEDNSPKVPTVTFDNETGVYTVKIGKEFTITPTIKDANNAIITWTLDGKIVSREIAYTATWDELGEFFPKLTVQTEYGKAEEEVKVEVVEFTPPVISIPTPSQGIKVLRGKEYTIEPSYLYDDLEEFKVEWIRDEKVVGTEANYTFKEDELGIYKITLNASNVDGSNVTEIEIEVVDQMPYSVSFPSQSYFQRSTDRYTFINRAIFLKPYINYYDDPKYSWTLNGELVECVDNTYKFTPKNAGEYIVKVTVTDGDKAETIISSEVTVHCVSGDESSQIRRGGSSMVQNKVYEWTAAPGQFINETGQFGGMTGNETTLELANAWAEQRFKDILHVSLGGFGGYIIVGFDHSIENKGGGSDFAIYGNAFDGSSEPGVVWVMQDINENGLPDDEWYELKGSETGIDGTIQDYAVTYYKPTSPKMDVQWSDSEGKSGCIDYLEAYHRQDYYYPAWIAEDSYTLRGTLLSQNNRQDPATGFWHNDAYDWGYVDNYGSDNMTGGSAVDGSGQRNGFKIANAIQADGTPIELQYIDFIKVQNGANAKSGWLGEVSTEVFGFQDLD